MNIPLKKFAERGFLRGRPQGRSHFAELCAILSNASAGEVVFLDFTGVKAVNGSWLNAAIGELFRWASEERNNVFPVLTHFPVDDLDELELVAQINVQAYPVAEKPETPLHLIRLIGPLDEALRSTLLAVIERGEATGADLGAEIEEEGIGATAWNNRLKDLFDLRLLNRRKRGRRQLYSAVAGEIDFNG